jgi:methionine sulfoxide reductase heme-binding subunit
MIATSSSPLWYLSRGTGVVTLVLFTLVIVLGILTKGGRPLPGLPRFAVAGLHRNASLLAIAFLVIHIVTAVIDPFVTIKWLDVFVPFVGTYHPLWIGLGALSLDLMLAVVVTSLLRLRIGRGVWRAVHWTAYAAWPLAIIHSFTLGPDVRSGLELRLAVACVLVSGLAIAWRLAVASAEADGSGTNGSTLPLSALTRSKVRP